MYLFVWHGDRLVADAISSFLADDEVDVFVAKSIDEIVAHGPSADVCLIDARTDAALEAITHLVAAPQAPRVLALVNDARSARTAMHRGASGWVTTSDGLDRLVRVLKSETPLNAVPSSAFEAPSRAARNRHSLTAREVEVLAGLVDGESTKALAARLGVTPATARTHVQNVLAKLGVHSRLEAVALVVEQSLLSSVCDMRTPAPVEMRATG